MSEIINDFKEFTDNIDLTEPNLENLDSNFTSLREEFLQEYPIKRLRLLTLDEYCLGSDNSKNSLSYKLEFGKYRYLCFGIGGGSAGKFGIYYSSSEGEYKHPKSSKLFDPYIYWEEFRNQLYDLISQGATIQTFNIDETYPLLSGKNVVVLKLLAIYYPDRYTPIAKRSALFEVYKYFGFEFSDSTNTIQLSYDLNVFLRNHLSSKDIKLNRLYLYLWRLYEKITQEKTVVPVISSSHNVWLYSPGLRAENWNEVFSLGIMYLNDSIGDIRNFNSKEEIKAKYDEIKNDFDEDTSNRNRILSRWQFANEMRTGDIVYVKKGRTTILGKGIVESEYLYDKHLDKYASHRKVKWLIKGEFDHSSIGDMPVKVLTEISKSKGYPEKIEALFSHTELSTNEYGRDEFLKNSFISDELYDSIINNLERKKNLILQGPPGVGKTFLAKRLFYSLMGEIDDTKIEMVQFHQSYSYEDFVQGYRPNDEGKFELKEGIFYKLTQLARQEFETNPNNPKKFAIIIDEINRGNLSKILGELLMLIDSDKRDKYWSIKLTYSDEDFYIPPNLYIIGTMNTADRSLSLVDYALRRRFTFASLPTAFESSKFKHYLLEIENIDLSLVNTIIDSMNKLNNTIKESLGEGFVIGHSYFINQLKESNDMISTLNEIFNYEIIPLLKEYYFDDEEKIKEALQIISIQG